MRILSVVLVAATLTLALAQPTSAQVRSTIIGPGVTRYPIAVAPLKQITGGASERFTEVLTRDLELSGLFRVLPRDAYIENAQTAGVTAEAINFPSGCIVCPSDCNGGIITDNVLPLKTTVNYYKVNWDRMPPVGSKVEVVLKSIYGPYRLSSTKG